MKNIQNWSLRELQIEAAYALVHYNPTIQEQGLWDKQAYHDSKQFYIAVINDFVAQWGDIPSRIVKGVNE